MHLRIFLASIIFSIHLTKIEANFRSRRITGEYSDQFGINAYSRMWQKWPWIVRLEILRPPNEKRRCGGALIARNLVLTAAHCVHGYEPKEITIYIGDIHVKLLDSGEHVVGVQEIIRHRFYHQREIYLNHCNLNHETVEICVNDVALLVLDTMIPCQYTILLPWNESIISIFARRFPKPIGFHELSQCHVAGWGYVSVLGPDSDMLRDADVKIMSNQRCNSTCLYGGNLLPGMICAAGDLERGQDACMGDSGGPLMCKKGDTWYLLGLVSWGFGCGDPIKPGVYTDVGFYQEWILTQLIQRPRLEAQFWNSVQECQKNSQIKIRECRDPWNWQILNLAGIKCPN